MLDVQALLSGDRRTLSKTLSAVERGEVSTADIDGAFESIEDRIVWGITGSPGVGKSSLIEQLLQVLISRGLHVAILSVDPTSPISGGALLGDRLRVGSADTSDLVYYRSLATRGNFSAVPATIGAMIRLLKAVRYDFILIETVGAGQIEFSVAAICDRLLLLEAPGLGDMLQAEKAGLMEMADVIAVNKSDLDGAESLYNQIRTALELSISDPPPVVLTSSKSGAGVAELVQMIGTVGSNSQRDMARTRIRLQFAWQRILLDNPLLEAVLNDLEKGVFTIDEALDILREVHDDG